MVLITIWDMNHNHSQIWHLGNFFSCSFHKPQNPPKLCTQKHTLTDNLKRDTYRLWTLGGHGRVKEEQRRRQSRRAATSRHYTHIPALPDTRTRPTGLVNLKARMEGGGFAGVCQEETAGTSQSGRWETARGQERGRQKQREFKHASAFFFSLSPPRFLWCNLTPEEQTHGTSSRPVLHQRLPLPLLSPFSLFSLSVFFFFGII